MLPIARPVGGIGCLEADGGVPGRREEINCMLRVQ